MADLLSTGISGVRTYQRALATVGNNIANVDTEGYSRQRVEIAQSASSSEGSLNLVTVLGQFVCSAVMIILLWKT